MPDDSTTLSKLVSLSDERFQELLDNGTVMGPLGRDLRLGDLEGLPPKARTRYGEPSRGPGRRRRAGGLILGAVALHPKK